AKADSAFCMYTHIIPCACLVRIIIPGGAYISMRARKHRQYMVVILKRFVMVRISHYMPGEEKFIVLFINEYRHLRGYRLIIFINTRQKDKRMLTHECKNSFFFLLFEIRKIVH